MRKKLWNKDFILLLQGNAVSTIGNLLALAPMLYMCFNPRTKEFVLNH